MVALTGSPKFLRTKERKVGTRRPYAVNGTVRESSVMAIIKSFVQDESGATAIEYGLIAAGIAVAIITVVQGLGTKLENVFANITSAIK